MSFGAPTRTSPAFHASRRRSASPPLHALEDVDALADSLLSLRCEIENLRGTSREEARSRSLRLRSAREARIEAVLEEWMPLPENMPPAPGGKEFLKASSGPNGGSPQRRGLGGCNVSCTPRRGRSAECSSKTPSRAAGGARRTGLAPHPAAGAGLSTRTAAGPAVPIDRPLAPKAAALAAKLQPTRYDRPHRRTAMIPW